MAKTRLEPLIRARSILGDAEAKQKLASARLLILGGEEPDRDLARRFAAAFPWIQVTNMYGPTEMSIGCMYHDVRSEEAGAIPIGRAIANVDALLLDRGLSVVAPGGVGEVALAGACMGHGYLNRPAMTEQAFVDIRTPTGESRPFYRTGDLATRLPNGELQFLGRVDQQLKIRGVRVEPREIEALLRQASDVDQVAVLARPDPSGTLALVAYVVVPDPEAWDHSSLASFARERLPLAYWPSAYVPVESIPVTATGKRDEGALPSPWRLPSRPTGARRQQMTSTQRLVWNAWSDVLGERDFGLDDEFVDIGGNSLAMVGVVAVIEDGIGIALKLREVMERATVRQLAELIDEQRSAE